MELEASTLTLKICRRHKHSHPAILPLNPIKSLIEKQKNSNARRWHAELEAACASEMEEKYKRYADLLLGHQSACREILAKVG